MFKQPATHLAQTVRSNLRPAAFGLPHHKRHAAHAELSGEVCAFGNTLLGFLFGGGVGQDFRCLHAADLSQYFGQHVQFCRVQAVFVAGFWAGAQGFQPALFIMASYPIKTEVMLIEPKASSSLNISILSCGSRSAAV